MQGPDRLAAYQHGQTILTLIWWKIYNTGDFAKDSMDSLFFRVDAEMNLQTRRPDLQSYGFQVNSALLGLFEVATFEIGKLSGNDTWSSTASLAKQDGWRIYVPSWSHLAIFESSADPDLELEEELWSWVGWQSHLLCKINSIRRVRDGRHDSRSQPVCTEVQFTSF